MWGSIVLISGGCFLLVMIATGLRIRLAGGDFKGRSPFGRPLFLTGKAAMGILWGMAFWRAVTVGLAAAAPSGWPDRVGAVVFAMGSALAMAALLDLGSESRFGLPERDCRLKTSGLYAWSRHPMYTGFYLMALGAGLYVFHPAGLVLLVPALYLYHRTALAEERFLAGRFDKAWRDYTNRVGRYGGPARFFRSPRSN
ncbi:MAG: isoprenylcysteine carboxylmethyltransferase family protein [Proteobacteria bacterium]|nr:isoprenylcysteine carboxylmethyltransferase family protein [Pseudomonadota bacterium]